MLPQVMPVTVEIVEQIGADGVADQIPTDLHAKCALAGSIHVRVLGDQQLEDFFPGQAQVRRFSCVSVEAINQVPEGLDVLALPDRSRQYELQTLVGVVLPEESQFVL